MARMTAESAAPRNASAVYRTLMLLSLLGLAVAGSVIGFIAYEYVTRPELRNPVHQGPAEGHG